MKVKVMAPKLGDLSVEMPVEEAKAVFDRMTGKTNSLPQPVLDRISGELQQRGQDLTSIPGLQSDVKLNYLVARLSDRGVIKRFEDLRPEDDIILMPPITGG
jgi:hypothetical protein